MHTKEPWVIGEGMSNAILGIDDAIAIESGDWHICAVWRDVGSGGEAEANARRIVACVNWCAGNDIEGMENAVSIGRPYTAERDSAIEREIAISKQRDELLAALKEIELLGNGDAMIYAKQIATRAIAKAEASQG